MINISDEFKELMSERQDFKEYAEVTLSDGTVLELTEDDFTTENNSLVDSAGANTIPLGIALSRNIQLEIMNDDDHLAVYDFFGAKIRLYLTFSKTTEEIKALGDKYGNILQTRYGNIILVEKHNEENDTTTVVGKIEFGTFTVTQPESYGDVVTIVGYDDMYKTDKTYSTSLTFPATAKSVLNDICNTCGLLLGSSSFLHDDFQIQEMPSEEYTFRQIIGYIAMIACGNARIDRSGYLKIMTYDFNYENECHDLTDYNTLTNDTDNVQVTGVQMTRTVTKTTTDEEGNESEDEEEEIVKYGTDGYVLDIENPLVHGKEETLVSWIYEKFESITFRGFTMDYISYPIAEFMDKIKVTDWRGKTFYSVLTDVNFVFCGYTTMQNSAESPIRNQSNYTSTDQKATIIGKDLYEKEKTQRENAVKRLNETLKVSSGMYSTEEKQQDGSIIYFLHDKPTIGESKNVIKLTAEAIGFSTNGGKDYPYGFMITGEMITRLLYAEGIDADYINTGAITVRDSDKNIIFQVDMDTGKVVISGDNITIGGKSIKDTIDESSSGSKKYADDLVSNLAESVTKNVNDLQNQIDGQIETFYYDYEPTLNNIPASEWNTEQEKQKHEGDLFYWKTKGYAYRFFKDGDTWKWQLVQDTDVTKALQTASNAQITADNKCRVFIKEPYPPYDVGDIWNQGQDGDILTCVVSRGEGATFVEDDWQKLNKYTDDETANKALEEARKSRAMLINLDNDYQAITTDYKGEYKTFPECHTTAQVLYGHTDITNDCTYSISKSNGIVGSWNSSSHTYNVTGLTTDVGWVDITATYLNTYAVTKRFDIAKLKDGAPGEKGETGATGPQGPQGEQGLQGLQGPQGEQGIAGPKGEDGTNGKTSYFHIKYSDIQNPTSSSQMSETPNTYIGTYVDFEENDSNDPKKYTWARFEGLQGEQGENGIPGTNGADGKTSYLHIAYANSADGKTDFSTGESSNKQYIGQYTDFTEKDSTDPTKYSWTKIQGPKGEQGQQGVSGRTYFMEPSAGIIKRSADDSMVPNYITLSGYYRDGNGTGRTAYAGRFKIEETIDGNTYTTVYTSSSDESSITHSLYGVLATSSGGTISNANSKGIGIPRDVAAIRCTFYASGGTSQILDMETIPVAIDVDALTHEEIFNLLTNDGAWQGIYKASDGKLYISFSYARGGTLRLGGTTDSASYGDGNLIVYSSYGNDIVTIDRDGVLIKNFLIKSGEKYPVSTISMQPGLFGGMSLRQIGSDGKETGKSLQINYDSLLVTPESTNSIYHKGVEITSKSIGLKAKSGDMSNVFYAYYTDDGDSEVDIYTKLYCSSGAQFNDKTIVYGDFQCTGTKKRIVDTNNYETRSQYCYETATPYFGDVGNGQIDETGKCYIDIDDIFSETVNTNIEYQVFLQKEGQGDLWVEEKTPNYFVVRGAENLKFSWELKAIQRDYEFERLEKCEDYEEKTINYEDEYLEEINTLMKEREELFDETVK